MDKHGKKMIAPIVITVILIVYFTVYFGLLVSHVDSLFFKLLLAVVPALCGALLIGVCVQRIREIKGGEEDDLSKY